MRKAALIKLIFSFVILSIPSTTLADISICPSIENDIARLTCFDENYISTQEIVEPQEALDTLNDLAKLSDPLERFEYKYEAGEPCIISPAWILSNPGPYSSQVLGQYGRLNLYEVSSIEVPAAYRPASIYVRVTLNRNPVSRINYINDRAPENYSTSRVEDIYAFQARRVHNEREMIVTIAPNVHKADKAQIVQAFRDLHQGCISTLN